MLLLTFAHIWDYPTMNRICRRSRHTATTIVAWAIPEWCPMAQCEIIETVCSKLCMWFNFVSFYIHIWHARFMFLMFSCCCCCLLSHSSHTDFFFLDVVGVAECDWYSRCCLNYSWNERSFIISSSLLICWTTKADQPTDEKTETVQTGSVDGSRMSTWYAWSPPSPPSNTSRPCMNGPRQWRQSGIECSIMLERRWFYAQFLFFFVFFTVLPLITTLCTQFFLLKLY